jgi:hypothetical protein
VTVASAMWSHSGRTALPEWRPAWARRWASGRWHASRNQSAQPLHGGQPAGARRWAGRSTRSPPGAKRRRRAGRSDSRRTAADETVALARWLYSGRTVPARTTARVGTAPGRWRGEISLGREAATPGQPLGRPAHDGRGDRRVGDVFVFRAHCPCQRDGPRTHCAGPKSAQGRPTGVRRPQGGPGRYVAGMAPSRSTSTRRLPRLDCRRQAFCSTHRA